jgi:GR25 family glycosyltransferase involved in LPS biosynthesis
VNILYINLEGALERRTSIEHNLAERASGVHYQRVSAVSAGDVIKNKTSGSIRPAEKACFLSHLKAIEQSLDYAGPTLILEDDAILGSQTIEILNRLLPTVSGVDVLFTDLAVTSIISMLHLFKSRRDAQGNDTVGIGNCREIHFAASTAYVLPTGESKRKVLTALTSFKSLDLPYDLALRAKLWDEQLTASFVFPFITSLSPNSATSQIQTEADKLNNVVYDSFRKLMFKESAKVHPDLQKEIECVPAEVYDREATIFASIMKLVLSEKFPA